MSHFITGRKYIPFYYWSIICPLYLLVENMSVKNVSVENMSVEKMVIPGDLVMFASL